MRLCCFAAKAELRDDHRQSTAAGKPGIRQSDASSMSRYRFRNQRPPKVSFHILGPWGLRLSAKRLGTNGGRWMLGIDWLDLLRRAAGRHAASKGSEAQPTLIKISKKGKADST